MDPHPENAIAPFRPGELDNFADRIRWVRTFELRVSVKEIARRLEYPTATVAAWENGVRPRDKIEVAQRYHDIAPTVPISWLLTGGGFPLQPLSHKALTIVTNPPIAPHQNKRAGTYGRADSVAASRVVPHTQSPAADHRDPRGHHPSTAAKLRNAG